MPWVNDDNDPDYGYDIHGPGGHWEGPCAWWHYCWPGLLVTAAVVGVVYAIAC